MQVSAEKAHTTVIAELGINHMGDMEMARQMIRLSAMCGADIAKFQWYRPVELLGQDSPHLGEAMGAQFNEQQHKELSDYCAFAGIEWCVSVFHPDLVEKVECIGIKRYKIGSRAVTNTNLLKEVAHTRKPVIVSLPSFHRPQLMELKNILHGNNLTVLYCIPNYPTQLSEIKLNIMSLFAQHVDNVGFSSHCPNIMPTLKAVNLGAGTVENHVVIDNSQAGCDVSSSLNFSQYSDMIKYIRQLDEMA